MCTTCIWSVYKPINGSSINSTIPGTYWPVGSEPDIPAWAVPTAFGFLLASSFIFCNKDYPWLIATNVLSLIGIVLRTIGERNLLNGGLYYTNLYFINVACIVLHLAVWQILDIFNTVTLEREEDVKAYRTWCFVTMVITLITTFAIGFMSLATGPTYPARIAYSVSLVCQIFSGITVMGYAFLFQLTCSRKKASLPKWKIPFCRRHVLTLLPAFIVMHISWILLISRSIARFAFIIKAWANHDFFDHPAWSVPFIEELTLFIVPLLWCLVILQPAFSTRASTPLPATRPSAANSSEPLPRYEEVELGSV